MADATSAAQRHAAENGAWDGTGTGGGAGGAGQTTPPSSSEEEGFGGQSPARLRRTLPTDLPTSLDDRRAARSYYASEETEVYDPWTGGVRYVSHPVAAAGAASASSPSGAVTSPLRFDLGFEDDAAFNRQAEDSDARLMEMLAAQAALRQSGDDDYYDGDMGLSGSAGAAAGGGADDRTIVDDPKLTDAQKRRVLQKALHMAASNGDATRVKRLLDGKAKGYVDVNVADEEGTPPLIYASCFGHHEVVSALLAAGALVDIQDQKNRWTALMWAMTNRHKDIAKTLLDSGASPDVQTSSGRRAYDFAQPNSDLSHFLQENGYHLGDAGVSEDFYHAGHEDALELEAENRDMERRMAMVRDAHVNLEVDLSNLGVDDAPEDPDDFDDDDHQDFVWDRCLHDQMFVFQESELNRILDVVITNMVPQRSQAQKPVPANIIFLAARYAHYHASQELLAELLLEADAKIDDKVKTHQWDMSVLAFWLSNVTLLLYYLQRDPGLIEVSSDFQVQLKGLIEDIFILIIRDAERRINRILFAAILDFEAFPLGIEFANEWKNPFKSKQKVEAPDFVGGTRPQPIGKATKPQNVTSILDSVLYVLDLYDVHSVITTQLISQIMYWTGAELFNAILTDRKYMARSKAMQIRMNMSVLTEWAQKNSRVPEHYENGAIAPSGESTLQATRKYLEPVDQLVQWLQIYSGQGEDTKEMETTIKNLSHLSTQQLLEVCYHYRYEVNEQYAPKAVRKFLQTRLADEKKKRNEARKARAAANSPAAKGVRPLSSMFGGGSGSGNNTARPQTPDAPRPTSSSAAAVSAATSPRTPYQQDDEQDLSEPKLLMPTNHELGFSAPTSFDMRVSYGAGIGGQNRERERKYQPSVPPDFLHKFDSNAAAASTSSGRGR